MFHDSGTIFKKMQNNTMKGRGGQRSYGNFQKIHLFWGNESSLNFKRMNVQHVTYLTYVTYITYHLLLFFTPTFLKDYLLLLQEETKAAPAEAKNVMI